MHQRPGLPARELSSELRLLVMRAVTRASTPFTLPACLHHGVFVAACLTVKSCLFLFLLFHSHPKGRLIGCVCTSVCRPHQGHRALTGRSSVCACTNDPHGFTTSPIPQSTPRLPFYPVPPTTTRGHAPQALQTPTLASTLHASLKVVLYRVQHPTTTTHPHVPFMSQATPTPNSVSLRRS